MSAPRRLVILGATGTIGVQCIDVLKHADPQLEVVALSAHSRESELRELQAGFPQARVFLSSNADQQEELLAYLRRGDYEICLNGVVGAAGLPYSEACLAAGRDLALANKESLVLAGELLMQLSRATGARILPVDSEHAAIHQCLNGAEPGSLRRLFLTASGGALRDLPKEQLADVPPAAALRHPNWEMGPRITIDSATMMNKALEVMEACHLFNVPPEEIKVLIHRQSVVHSMVEYIDGSILAQLGPPDMAHPIHYALHYPQRHTSPLEGFDPQLFAQLSFEEPDLERYPALALGFRAARQGGASGAILNAADEVAVEAYLAGQLAFGEIAALCASVLDQAPDSMPSQTIDEILAADQWAREQARHCLAPSQA